jgi:predicted kinase
MAGMPGSGKSTVALALGSVLGRPVIDKDVILSASLGCDVPEQMAQPASYAVLLALGRELVVNQQLSVILDSPASWQSTAAAEDISRDGEARRHILLCLADRDTRNQRVRTRTAQRSQPVGVSTTDGNGSSRFQHLPAGTLHINTEGPLDTIVADVLERLGMDACKTH